PVRLSARARKFRAPATPAMLYFGPLGLAESALQFYSFNADYVESLCAGNQQAQEHFAGYFTELLQLKLRSRLQSPQAIEDVRQETLARVLSVLRKDGGLRQPERLGAFVNMVCNHVLFEHYRSAGRSESLDVEGQSELLAVASEALEMVAAGQIKDKVREILLDLAPRDRLLLKAVFLDERDRDEVCREFGVDRDYLRVLLHRAKQEFKTEYVKRIGNPMPLGANA
ncbi:MAG: sigma-70 family RNA polymerase sigma factor, partial [Terracidiphilus sp.]